MVGLVLVRHGKSRHGFDHAADSPLSEAGFAQARAAARRIAADYSPMPIFSSPLLRARQSAALLAELWGCPVTESPAATEIPVPGAPGPEDPAGRRAALSALMAARYGDLPPQVLDWRRGLLGFIAGLGAPALVFTHYLSINAVMGAINGDDRVVVCDPGHCQPMEIVFDGDKTRLGDA